MNNKKGWKTNLNKQENMIRYTIIWFIWTIDRLKGKQMNGSLVSLFLLNDFNGFKYKNKNEQ